MNATEPHRITRPRPLPRRSPRALLALFAGFVSLSASGCLLGGGAPPPQPGDISFGWSFAGESRCAGAGVAEIGLQIFDSVGDTVYEDVIDCQGVGLLLTDFYPDRYEIWLDAFSASGELLFQGEGSVRVQPGQENDAGILWLDRLTREGALGLYWSFLYPTDNRETYDCVAAGVYEVDVEVAPLDGQGSRYAETFACGEEGLLVDRLPAGAYRVTLLAYGRYDDQDLALYERVLETEVFGDATTELGDVALDRIYEGFADIEVSWAFPMGGCAQAGVTEIEFTLDRLNPQLEDDFFVVECSRGAILRDTFVPGSYLLTAFARGAGGDYTGAVTFEAMPNHTAAAQLQLVRQ